MSASSPLDRVRENLRRDEPPWDSLIDNHRICRVWKDDLALLVALADAFDQYGDCWQHSDPCRKTRYPRTGPCDCGLTHTREAIDALTTEAP